MGEIVAAIFTTHVPRLMIHDPEARRAYMGKNVTTFYDAMESLERERLRALEFDTFVLIDTHWFTTLEYVLNAQERLRGLYTSEELPQMIHEYAFDYPGDPELAAAIGLLDPARLGTREIVAQIAAVIERRKSYRTIIPDSEIWREAGILSGILARLQGYGKDHRRRALNDALLFATARKHGCTVLTRNTADFDLLQQLEPSGRVLFYK